MARMSCPTLRAANKQINNDFQKSCALIGEPEEVGKSLVQDLDIRHLEGKEGD